MAEMLVQSESLTAIADEIRILSGTEDPMSLDSMKTNVAEANTNVDTEAELIAQISAALEGKASFDTSDATAVANDIYRDKTAYVNGEKIKGTMYVALGGMTKITTPVAAPGSMPYVNMTHSVTQRTIIDPEQGSTITLQAPFTDFGDAAAADVAVGKTFTSAAGLKVEGTMEAGVELPTLENPGTAADLAEGKQLIGADGNVVTGTVMTIDSGYIGLRDGATDHTGSSGDVSHICNKYKFTSSELYRKGSSISVNVPFEAYGNATAADVAKGKTFTSASGLLVEGTALLPGGGFVYPDGAFIPVTSFTDGKQYALVSMIGGVRRYINTTDYNQYTMNATEITIGEDAGDYVIFSATPALFTAVASGDGFLLQNGSNYLHGTSSGGTALRVGTTQAVWTVDSSATGGFSEGKYHAKEDANAVWLFNNTGGYNWSIKYETAGSFGYDRDGRDNTYSTGFTPFVLYELVEGEDAISPGGDSSNAMSVKSGTTTNRTIDTGLSEIEEFFIYKESQTATGLIHLHYSKTGGTSQMYASAWSTSAYGTKTITNNTTAATVSGGSITLPSNTATSGGLSSGVTYKWVAVGME